MVKKEMTLTDRVYDAIEITEPVLVDLINSPTLQRLKHIDMAGYFEPHFPGSARSRFEHSVGVSWLLKTYGAPLEEQIAGLIHDVSHSAFSHCIDYVLSAGSETSHDHQDNVFDEFVRKSAIPPILAAHGIALDYILDDKNFPLKERDLPNLCADRIDYSLRTGRTLFGPGDVEYFLQHLTARNGQWMFDDFASAKKYADFFAKLNSNFMAGLPSAVMFRTVGDYLKHALAKGYITEGDLYTTDNEVLQKIAPHHKDDTQLRLYFDRMNNKIPFRNDPANYDAEVFCKSRAVDPLCMHDGDIKRVSEIDPEWKEVLTRESRPKHYFLKFGA